MAIRVTTIKSIYDEGYPVLKKYVSLSNSGSFVVLFVAPREGTVIASENSARPVGDYLNEWSEDLFIVAEGQYLLENVIK